MPARGPSLVLTAVEATAVAGGTLVAAVFFTLLCRNPYVLRSSVGLGLRLVKLESCCGEEGKPDQRLLVFPKSLALRSREMAAESLLAQGS